MLATAIELSVLMWCLFIYGYWRLSKLADEALHEDHG